ncbi:MAG: VCBS repeat-containing protein [Planctomycetaceae bacterium]|nr:VCBS repeat-containing protein [Planctomycetaceae bacterium]
MPRFHGFLAIAMIVACTSSASALDRLQYNHPGLVVDLGVGLWAWPLPMDWDGDGDLDLVVSCPDAPFNGTYFFENPAGKSEKRPVFKPPVKVGPALKNAQLSYVDGRPRVLTPGVEWTGFLGGEFKDSQKIYPKTSVNAGDKKIRANQWRYVDFDHDGALDLVVGLEDWEHYGWDDAFNPQGEWTHGPLHGYVYLVRNTATTDQPKYAEPVRLTTNDGKLIDTFGMPSPSFGDFDKDGDLDLLCGEFLDGFTYFANLGTRSEPKYAPGQRLQFAGEPLTMHLQMITPTAIDWDADGDLDLIVGDEDGRVAFIEHTGRVTHGVPEFKPPTYFQQEAKELKFGALVTPVGVDWDGDGDDDLVCGNTSGNIGWFENLDGGHLPKWSAPRLLEVDGKPIRLQAGPNGSIQGPAEAKWGYTTLSVADWDHDGKQDLVVNSIWGKVVWFKNLGGTPAKLAAVQPVAVDWPSPSPKPAWNWWNPTPGEMVTQWRTTPVVVDLDKDGLNDIAMLDHEGYFAWFPRARRGDQLVVLPGKRVFTNPAGEPLQLNAGYAGKSGRRKLSMADWDGDGQLDLLANSLNVSLFRNVGTPEHPWALKDEGPLSDHKLAGHDTSPTTVDWNKDGKRDLVIGAEDGFFYYLQNPAK